MAGTSHSQMLGLSKVCHVLFGGFLKWGYPQIIHFSGIFPYKPTILGYPHLRKPPSSFKRTRYRFYIPFSSQLPEAQREHDIPLGANGANGAVKVLHLWHGLGDVAMAMDFKDTSIFFIST